MEQYEIEHIKKIRALSPECMDALNDHKAKYPLTRTQLEENAARIIDMALTVKRSKQ